MGKAPLAPIIGAPTAFRKKSDRGKKWKIPEDPHRWGSKHQMKQMPTQSFGNDRERVDTL